MTLTNYSNTKPLNSHIISFSNISGNKYTATT